MYCSTNLFLLCQVYGINHEGVTQKQTYEDLIDDFMGRTTKTWYHDGDVKLLSESPTLSNLLDGDGQ